MKPEVIAKCFYQVDTLQGHIHYCGILFLCVKRKKVLLPFGMFYDIFHLMKTNIWNKNYSLDHNNFLFASSLEIYLKTITLSYLSRTTKTWAMTSLKMVKTRVVAVLFRGLLWHVTLSQNIHSILWCNSAEFLQDTYGVRLAQA